jgi:hypothetical protein
VVAPDAWSVNGGQAGSQPSWLAMNARSFASWASSENGWLFSSVEIRPHPTWMCDAHAEG